MLEAATLFGQALGAAFLTSTLDASELIVAVLVAAGFLVSGVRGPARGEAEQTERQTVPVRPRP